MQTAFRRSCACWLAVALGLGTLAPSQAQTDPTRPASAWLAAQQQGVSGDPLAEPSAPGVQIVVIGASRKFAMINGHPVRQGETYNGAKLLAVNEDGAVWQRDGAKEKSSMSPGIQKKLKSMEPTADKAKSNKKTVNGRIQ